jgi:hypothetical protein
MGGTRKGVEREKPTGPTRHWHSGGTAHGSGMVVARRWQRGEGMATARRRHGGTATVIKMLVEAGTAKGRQHGSSTAKAQQQQRWRWWSRWRRRRHGEGTAKAQRHGSSTAAARRRHSIGGSASSVLRTRTTTTVICSNGHMQWSTSPWLGEGTGREAHQACGGARGACVAAQHKPTAHLNTPGAARHACVSNYGRAGRSICLWWAPHLGAPYLRALHPGRCSGASLRCGVSLPLFSPAPCPSCTFRVPAPWHRQRRALQRPAAPPAGCSCGTAIVQQHGNAAAADRLSEDRLLY